MRTIKRVLRRLNLPVHGLSKAALAAIVEAHKERRLWRPCEHRKQWLRSIVRSLSRRIEMKPGHWFLNDIDDVAIDWCMSCAEKRVLEIRAEDPERLRLYLGWTAEEIAETSNYELCRRHKLIDGGWSTDLSSPAFCNKCGVMLDHTLTRYGAGQEIAHWVDHGPIPIDHAEGWACMELACNALRDSNPLWLDVQKIVMRSILASVPRKSRLCRNTRARRGAK